MLAKCCRGPRTTSCRIHFFFRNFLQNKQATCLAKKRRSRLWISGRLLTNVVGAIRLQFYVSLTTQELSNRRDSEDYMKYLEKYRYRHIWWIWSEHCTNRTKWGENMLRQIIDFSYGMWIGIGVHSAIPDIQHLWRIHNEIRSWRFKRRKSEK